LARRKTRAFEGAARQTKADDKSGTSKAAGAKTTDGRVAAARHGSGRIRQVSLAEMTRAIQERMHLDKEVVKGIALALIGEVTEQLVDGALVTLDDLATLRIVEQRASIVRDEAGHRLIAPASKALSAEPHGAFRNRIERTRLASILLVVPRNDPFARVVDFHFSRVGWRVLCFHSVQECMERVVGGDACLVIVDHALEDAERLVRRIKCGAETSLIPVVGLFPRGKDPERADTFRVCGDEHLAEPFEVYTLLTLAEAELERISEEQALFRQQVCMQLPTEEGHIEEAGRQVAELLAQSGLDSEKQIALNAAFREALLNAAQHGNRYDRNRQIRILYLLDNEKVSIVVGDEGPGFDYHYYLDRSLSVDPVSAARERYEQGLLGGLGIMLMMRCSDRMEYNEKGNALTLRKYLKSPVLVT